MRIWSLDANISIQSMLFTNQGLKQRFAHQLFSISQINLLVLHV